MALDAIKGAAYKESVSLFSNSSADNGCPKQPDAVNLNITEEPDKPAVSANSQTGGGQEKAQKDKVTSEKQIKSAVSQANSRMKEHMTRCEFSFYDDTNLISIKVIDKETDKVIKEIPPKETLEMIEKLMDLAGLLVDERR